MCSRYFRLVEEGNQIKWIKPNGLYGMDFIRSEMKLY